MMITLNEDYLDFQRAEELEVEVIYKSNLLAFNVSSNTAYILVIVALMQAYWQ